MWHKARAQPSQSGAGWPATCPGRLMHGVSNAQVGAATKHGRPATLAGRSA
jgi:hypothetical protein